MKSLKSYVILLTAFCFLSVNGFSCYAQEVKPVYNIDFSNTKLMLPIDSKGGCSGTAIEIKNVVGYEYAPYFVKNADGSQDYKVKIDCATSSGSHYPRTENQETKNGESYVFPASEGALILSELAIKELPKLTKGKKSCVVFNQFHGKSNELMREQYCDDNYVSYMNDKSGPYKKELEHYLIDIRGNKLKVPLGEFFQNRAEIKDNTLFVTANYQGIQYSYSEQLSDYFLKDIFFAKYGAYAQVSGKPKSGAGNIGTGQAWVRFNYATISHPGKAPTGNNCACP